MKIRRFFCEKIYENLNLGCKKGPKCYAFVTPGVVK